MKSRRALFISVAALALAVLALWWTLRAKPATYQGKTAAEWFRAFSKARLKNQRVYRFGSSQVIYFPNEQGPEADPSTQALRKLGTNAAIYLSHRIDRGLSSWAQSYTTAYSKLPPSLAKLIPKPPPPEEDAISAALILLGRDAAPAVPNLIRALSRGTMFQKQMYLNTLSRLPYRREEVEPVLQSLVARGEISNAVTIVSRLHIHTAAAAKVLVQAMSGVASPMRSAAWNEASDFREEVPIFLPVINSALKATPGSERMQALRVLKAYGPNASPAIPGLLTCLRLDDADVRYETARVFEEMGTNALPALSALCQATNDSSLMVRRCSARVISNLTYSVRQ